MRGKPARGRPPGRPKESAPATVSATRRASRSCVPDELCRLYKGRAALRAAQPPYTRPVVNCIVVELTDGSVRAYSYPDEESAEAWYRECRAEWNAGRNLIFYFRRTHGPSSEMHFADNVAHLELASGDSVKSRGVESREAVIFG
jgi:hypothetical protein